MATNVAVDAAENSIFDDDALLFGHGFQSLQGLERLLTAAAATVPPPAFPRELLLAGPPFVCATKMKGA